VIVVGLGLVLPAMLWFAAVALSNRVGGTEMGNSSWAERTASLRIGWSLLAHSNLSGAVFGLGVGQMSPALWNEASIEAVYSVLLTYLYETGLVGAVALGAVGYVLARVWKRTGFSLAFAAIGAVWAVGATVTTSYEQLLSPWLVLGWMTVWTEFCDVSAAAPAPVRAEMRVSEPGVVVSAAPSFVPKRWSDQ
jgi:hypothetical protein